MKKTYLSLILLLSSAGISAEEGIVEIVGAEETAAQVGDTPIKVDAVAIEEVKPKSVEIPPNELSEQIMTTMGELATNFNEFKEVLPKLQKFEAFRNKMTDMIGKQIDTIKQLLKKFDKMPGANKLLEQLETKKEATPIENTTVTAPKIQQQ